MSDPTFRPYSEYVEFPSDEMSHRAEAFHARMATRRSIRQFSDRPVPREIVEHCVATATLAPSGANQQPWHFACVQDGDVKRQIREAAEAEEREFYQRRAPQAWLDALEPFGTDSQKPFLETAPWLIAIFAQSFGVNEGDSSQVKHYYVQESVGIAVGFLIAAFTNAGLATLTHTPSPMGFLRGILDRPDNERAFLLLVVGYPADDARVPDINKKPIEETVSWY